MARNINVEAQRRSVKKSPNMAVKTDCGYGVASPIRPPRAAAAYLRRYA